MDNFVAENYCDISVQCDSRCCLFGECVEYSECFERYDLPILYGLAGGIAVALLLILLAYICTPRKKQKLPPLPPPPVIVEEDMANDDLAGPIYYEGEDKPIPDMPPPPPPVVEEVFEDKLEMGYYDDKSVKLGRQVIEQ